MKISNFFKACFPKIEARESIELQHSNFEDTEISTDSTLSTESSSEDFANDMALKDYKADKLLYMKKVQADPEMLDDFFEELKTGASEKGKYYSVTTHLDGIKQATYRDLDKNKRKAPKSLTPILIFREKDVIPHAWFPNDAATRNFRRDILSSGDREETTIRSTSGEYSDTGIRLTEHKTKEWKLHHRYMSHKRNQSRLESHHLQREKIKDEMRALAEKAGEDEVLEHNEAVCWIRKKHISGIALNPHSSYSALFEAKELQERIKKELGIKVPLYLYDYRTGELEKLGKNEKAEVAEFFAKHIEPKELSFELHLAFSSGDVEMVRALEKRVDSKEFEKTLRKMLKSIIICHIFLMELASRGNVDMLNFVSQKISEEEFKDHIKMMDNFGRTPLSFAAESGHTDVIKFLLSKMDEEEIREQLTMKHKTYKSFFNPLFSAVREGHIDTVELFAEKMSTKDFRKQLKAKNLGGKTALDLAKEKGHEEIVKILEARLNNK